MQFVAKNIFEAFKAKLMDKNVASEQLIYLINNSENDDIREECIEYLEKIGLKSKNVFEILENLLVSESNINIKSAAFYALRNNFLYKSLNPFKYCVEHDDSFLLIQMVESLAKIDRKICRNALIEKLKKLYGDAPNHQNFDILSFNKLKEIFDDYIFKKSLDALYHFRRIDPNLPFDLDYGDND